MKRGSQGHRSSRLRLMAAVALASPLLTGSAWADIFQWSWVDPLDPSKGKYQSTVLTPAGAGLYAEPEANLAYRDLRQAYLIGFQLGSVHFNQANLTNADLSHADLTKSFANAATFTNANLADSTLTSSDISNIDFRAADFSRSNLSSVFAPGCNFSNATFANANLTSGLFNGSTFNNADLHGTNFTRAYIDGCNFSGMDLSGLNFGMASGSSVNFSGAKLDGANLAGATFAYGNFSGAKMDGVAAGSAQMQYGNFKGASLRSIDLSAAKLRGSTFSDADLSGANLTKVILWDMDSMAGASFDNAIITGADLSYTVVRGFTAQQFSTTWNYRQHDLRGMTLSFNNLSNWDFSKQDLRNADLSNATLTGANFDHAKIAGINFGSDLLSGVKLTNVNFAGVDPNATFQFSGANLSGATLSGSTYAYSSLLSLTNLTNADLSGSAFQYLANFNATLNGANLIGTRFVTSNKTATLQLRDARITGADFSGLTFTDPTQITRTASYKANELRGVKFPRNLGTLDLTNKDLRYASFGGATISGVNFTGASINFATFLVNSASAGLTQNQFLSTASYQNHDLVGVALTGTLDSSWDFSGRDVRKLGFYSVNAPGGTFAGANLAGATFDTADLDHANFASAKLRGATFFNSWVAGANFTGADLTDAWMNTTYGSPFYDPGIRNSTITFTGAILTDATITGAQMTQATAHGLTEAQIYSTASYKNRDLHGINLSGCSLVGWTFSNQDLHNAAFTFATLTSANFQGARIDGADFFGTGITAGTLYSTASYQNHDLHGITLSGDLSGWDFSDQDLSNAYLSTASLLGANFSNAKIRGTWMLGDSPAGFSAAQLISTQSYKNHDLGPIRFFNMDLSGVDFSGQDLRGAELGTVTLTGANFTDALIGGLQLDGPSNLTVAQLSSTASYKLRDLRGVSLSIAASDPSPQDFSDMRLDYSRIGGISASANFAGAVITGAFFSASQAQLMSTASYAAKDLRGVTLSQPLDNVDLRGFRLEGATISGTNLLASGAVFSDGTFNSVASSDFRGAGLRRMYLSAVSHTDFTSADLRGTILRSANTSTFTCADLRDATLPYAGLSGNTIQNIVMPNGIFEQGLFLTAGQEFIARDYAGTPDAAGVLMPKPLHVREGMTCDPAASIGFVFEDSDWGSTISFDPAIPVSLDGALNLDFADGADPNLLVGASFRLFDWTGVTPKGSFTMITSNPGVVWDTTNLYTSGYVTLLSVPEPSVALVAGALSGAMLRRRRGGRQRLSAAAFRSFDRSH